MPVLSPNNELNAFSILMNNSRKLLLFQHCTEYNGHNQLFNEIIELFQSQKVGWMDGTYNTIGKLFLNRITDTLWYIDPHLSTLNARSYHLPILFTQLKTYRDGKVYNKSYHTSYHKKNPLLQQKLSHLSSSLELSIGQLWANDDIWNQVMPAILILVENLKKYAKYLITTATA
ncbi:hypothetical protein C1646_764965 [Rhizophagus diaphanus]|nr:hypothetical protein C1646_764965 [Rhizophagus diaphanus] [Rhizophagus sp. MUCL 43196]